MQSSIGSVVATGYRAIVERVAMGGAADIWLALYSLLFYLGQRFLGTVRREHS